MAKRGRANKSNPAVTILRGIGAGALVLLRLLLKYLLPVLIVILAAVTFAFFCRHYFRDNEAFVVNPSTDILIGGANCSEFTAQRLRRDLRETLGVTKPQNGFELLRSDIVERLRKTPYIRDVKMTYDTAKNVIRLEVTERAPLAIMEGRPRLYVNEEGILFIPARRQALPFLEGLDLPQRSLMPGFQLSPKFHCMLRLIAAVNEGALTLPTGCRVASVGLRDAAVDVEDGLVMRLTDGREVTLAWDGMGLEIASATPEQRERERQALRKRLGNLSQVLNNPELITRRHIDATTKNIAVSN